MNIATSTLSVQEAYSQVIVPDKEWARINSCILLAISDIAAIALGFFAYQFFSRGFVLYGTGMDLFLVVAPVYVGIATLNRAYTGQVLNNVSIGIFRCLQAFSFAAASILLMAYFLKAGSDISRLSFTSGCVLSAVFLTTFRYWLRRPILFLLGGTPYTTVIVNDGTSYKGGEFDIVIDAVALGFDPATQDPIRFHALAQAITNADRVIVACPRERYADWSSVLKGMAINGEIITDEHDPLGILGVGKHSGRRTMIVAIGPLALRDRVIKRALDVMISSIGLLVLSPLLIATMIAIKMESKGPVLFIQHRIGRDNRLFRIYKFRSMYTDMCDAHGSKSASRTDSRITRVGAIIRRTSIDELPQLLNVLKGDMSIVGPRPHAMSSTAADMLFWDVDPRYRHRHSVKPGVTGLAQIRGFRGATDHSKDLTDRLQSDLEYVANWSIWRDFLIILRTFKVLAHDNAF